MGLIQVETSADRGFHRIGLFFLVAFGCIALAVGWWPFTVWMGQQGPWDAFKTDELASRQRDAVSFAVLSIGTYALCRTIGWILSGFLSQK